jgi:hypothetical protein
MNSKHDVAVDSESDFLVSAHVGVDVDDEPSSIPMRLVDLCTLRRLCLPAVLQLTHQVIKVQVLDSRSTTSSGKELVKLCLDKTRLPRPQALDKEVMLKLTVLPITLCSSEK